MTWRKFGWCTLCLFVAAGTASAQSYRDGRVRHAEPGVSVQRASETSAEEALPNLPFLPGDRVWTDYSGRVEFEFADGTAVRLDLRSKLDYVAREEPGRSDERVVLRLWSGSAFVHTGDRRESAEYLIEAPGGLVAVRDRSVVRVDAQAGETRVSVYEGEAQLDNGRRVTVRDGERLWARDGDLEGPVAFARADYDDFADWDARQEEDRVWADGRREYLPDEVAPYATELDTYGTWYNDVEVGYVWRPRVVSGWRPYLHGRWVWTAYGWTWVPQEPWGWAPYHYGRWNFSGSLGWYWSPGASWGPAWVSWAVGPSYVGWCALDRHDRPVFGHDFGRQLRGHAVSRGSVGTPGWVFVQRGDLTSRDVARRRLDPGRIATDQVRVVNPTQNVLTRELRVSESRAVPRNIRTRPNPGDTVPELRTDPATTIPFAVPRTRYESERERERARQQDDARAPLPSGNRYERRQPADSGASDAATTRRPYARPSSSRVREGDRAPAGATGNGTQASSDAERARARRPNVSEPEREVVRPFFAPLSRQRPPAEDGGARSGASDRPRSGTSDGDRGAARSRARSEDSSPPPPRAAAPRAQPRQPEARRAPTTRERTAPREHARSRQRDRDR